MKRLAAVVLCIMSDLVYGQAFSFELYFEDATGQKDTLVFGYDQNATDGIDAIFQEINMISQPWSNQFETRILIPENPFDYGNDEYNYISAIGHLKKQIKQEDCQDQSVLISMIELKNPVYPILISWDNSLFNDQCKINSIITDWHPGGWFDAFPVGIIPQLPFELSATNSATFDYTSIHHINANSDTLDVLYFVIGNNNQVFVNTNELDKMALNVYPNPSTDGIFQLSNELQLTSAVLTDVKGLSYAISIVSNQVDVSRFTNGVYFLTVELENGMQQTLKLIKE
ncbi:MAG: T9SS type A sorting domain-containing protein [Flavobacteriales bacterium]